MNDTMEVKFLSNSSRPGMAGTMCSASTPESSRLDDVPRFERLDWDRPQIARQSRRGWSIKYLR